MRKYIRLLAILGLLTIWSPTIAAAQTEAQPPTVHLDNYTGKPTHAFSFAGSGFVPGEQVDVFLGAQTSDPLASLSADAQGDIESQNTTIPFLTPGDYRLIFVGHSSQSPVSVGFNVQGFAPWVVLDNYALAPRSEVGFHGEDYIPGEVVQVYLNSRLSQPIAQVTADSDGHFANSNAFALPDLTGNNQLIFVGQQSQTEVTATFAVVFSPPSNTD
jgi:hypothetical protein